MIKYKSSVKAPNKIIMLVSAYFGLKKKRDLRSASIVIKVFRYSFSEAIPIFFNRFKSDFILV